MSDNVKTASTGDVALCDVGENLCRKESVCIPEAPVCTATQRSIKDVLMANAKKVKVDASKNHAGIYVRRLVNIPKTEPWYGLSYFGQVNRSNCKSTDDAIHKRWKEEDRQAASRKKDIGLMAAISMYGPDALESKILHRDSGSDRRALQKWVDNLERKYIRENGGPFRGDGTTCTLNLTHGGAFGFVFDSWDALRTAKWNSFKRELLAYVEVEKTALIDSRYVAASKFKLGKQVVQVRTGVLWRGHPEELERVGWLESLPGWVWRARDSPEFIESVAQRTRDQFANASEETLATWNAEKSAAHSTPAAVEASSSKATAEWKAGIGFGSASAIAASAEARATDEFRDNLSCLRREAAGAKHATAMERMSDEEKVEYKLKVEKTRERNATRERALAALRKVSGWENSGLRDLQRARQLGVIPNFNTIGNFENAYESQKAALAELKKIPGWENAMHRDVSKARKLGLIPDGRKRKRVF